MLATWGTSTGFNPASLFSGGVQGAWYDPSDNTTMFQTLGGPAVTAVEQAVGLILDKSKGLQVTQISQNSNFSAGGTDWVAQAGWTVIVGSASVVTTTGGRYIRTATDAVANSWYAITFTVSSITGGTLSGAAGTAITPVNVTTAGTYTHYVNASGAGGVGLFAGANTTATVTSIDAKLIAGNHAVQTTSASRPTLRARYNLLTYSEDQSNAAWTNFNATQVSNVATAPDGTLTADRIVEAAGSNTQSRYCGAGTNPLGQPITVSCYAKAAENSIFNLSFSGSGITTWFAATFDLASGLVTKTGAGANGTVVSSSITSVGNGWFRCSVVGTLALLSGNFLYVGMSDTTNPTYSSYGVVTYSGNIAKGLLVWGAQAVQTNVFPSNVYQRIAAATDYDTGAAFPQYLAFDGTDDSLLTANVDFATVTSDGAARRNLLLNPTQFDVSATWVPSNSSVTANATTAPDGTTTADKLLDNAVTGGHFLTQSVTLTAATHTYSIYVKRAERNWCVVYSGGANVGAYFDLLNGVVGSSFVGAPTSTSIQNVGDGWFRCSITFTAVASSTVRIYTATADGLATYTGDGTSGIFLWGAQLETGSTATAFQNIGTDKMTVFTGLSKLSDAATAMIVELSASVSTNNGSFYFIGPTGASGNNYQYATKGTVSDSITSAATFTSPITNVVTNQSDIGAPSVSVRINGSLIQTRTATQGTGNFLSYPLYIGRRNNATLPFNGRIYSLIVRGAASNSSQVAQTERYVASKTPLGVVP